jgi:hypothetical protein
VGSLQALLTGDLVRRAKQHIAAIRGSADAAAGAQFRSVLSSSDLDDARLAFHDQLFRGVVVTGLWLAPLIHRELGVADRLGISPLAVEDKRGSSRGNRGSELAAIVDANEQDFESMLSARSAVRLLVGGSDLARAVAAAEISGTSDVEWIAAGRVAEVGIRWWFERVRGLAFQDTDAIQRIAKLTSGSMHLLHHLDGILASAAPNESTVSTSMLDSVFQRYLGSIVECSARLRSGPTSVRLEGRELEVLKMLYIMARECGGINPETDFTAETWEYCQPNGWGGAPPTEDDAVHLLLLRRLGLYTTDADGSIKVLEGDPLYDVARLA